MLRLEHVTKHYKGFDLDCSMEVRPGCVTGLIGKNGAGKSTTFKAILGLIRPEGGSIQVFKKPSESLSLQDKEEIGTVLSDSGFSGYLTVKELIPVLCAMYPNFQKDDFLRKCEEFSIPRYFCILIQSTSCSSSATSPSCFLLYPRLRFPMTSTLTG